MVDETANLASGDTFLSVGKLLTPDYQVDGATINFSLKNMDSQGYEKFMEIYTQTMSAAVAHASAPEKSSDTTREILENQITAAGFQMAIAYERLLQQGVEFQITDLLVKLPEGNISGEMTLRLLKNVTLMGVAPVIGQPDLVLDMLYLKSQLRLPAALVEQVPTLLAPVHPGMQTGIFIKKDHYLEHRAETKEGKFLLNGKKFNLNVLRR